MLNKTPIVAVILFFLSLLNDNTFAAQFVNHYSPKNAQRPRRRDTYFIILHTTEGPAKGSLQKLWENGEAHYLIDTDGKIYRLINHDRVAFHSGRSMWAGRTGIDDYSIGVEIVGYYNRSITTAQYTAIKELISAMQKIYRVPDAKVLTHSMVAYGAPNRWHPRSHRGRKRCGTLFARDSVRSRLGLSAKPSYDPDVRSGRLVVADPELAGILYGRETSSYTRASASPVISGENTIGRNQSAWDIARDRYNSPGTVYAFPDGTRKTGSQITDWKNIPAGTKVIIGDSDENCSEGVQQVGKGAFPMDIAGDEFNSAGTFYFYPDGTFGSGDKIPASAFSSIPEGTRMLVGYAYGGQITEKRSAYDICGKRWNFPSTYYLLNDGSLRPGSSLDERQIPRNAHIFYEL